MKKIIEILDQPIEINAESNFADFDKFVNQFPIYSSFQEITKKVPVIKICASLRRDFTLSGDNLLLTINIPKDSFFTLAVNQMFMYQFIFRFWALNYFSKGYLLLHGSTSVTGDGRTVLFGDMAGNMGKTLSLVEMSLRSLEDVMDEFTFYETEHNSVHGLSFVPLHLRLEVRNHLRSCHNIKVDKDFVLASDLGIQNKLSSQLDLICYTVFGQETKITELKGKEKIQAFSTCATAHVSKLLNPRLDRLSFLANADSASQVIPPPAGSILAGIEKVAERVTKTIPSFCLQINNPCQIPEFVNQILSKHVYA